MPSLLFIAPADPGEAVLSTAALEMACARAPDAALTIYCAPAHADLFRAAPGLKAVRRLSRARGFGLWLDIARLCAGERFDLVLDWSGARAGYAVRAGRRIMRPPARRLRHRLEEIAEAMGVEAAAPKIWLDERARSDAEIAPAGPFVALAVGGPPRKRWPDDRFAAVARRLASGAGPLAGAPVLLLADAAEADVARAVAVSLDADGVVALNLAGRLDPLAAAALLERATLFIGGEGARMQIAAAMGAPTLGLFGPSDERQIGPSGPRARALRGRAYEEIMAQAHPSLDERSLMEDVSVDAVEAAALDLLRAGGFG